MSIKERVAQNARLRQALLSMTGIIAMRPAEAYMFDCPEDAFANLCKQAVDAYSQRSNMCALADELSKIEGYCTLSALEVLLDPNGREFMREYIRDGWNSWQIYCGCEEAEDAE